MGKGVIHSLVSASSAITQLIQIPAQKQTPNIVLISYSCQIAKMVIWQDNETQIQCFFCFANNQVLSSIASKCNHNIIDQRSQRTQSSDHISISGPT